MAVGNNNEQRHFDKIWRINVETSSFSNQFSRKNQVAVLHGTSVLNVVLQNKWIQEARLICNILKQNTCGHSFK